MKRTFLVLALLGTALLSPRLAWTQGPPPAKVAVDAVTRETVREGVTLIGNVEAFQTSTVASLTEGRTVRLYTRTGDRVRRGDPLAALDTTQREIELDQARARAEAARVALAQAEADLDLARALLPQQAVSSDLVATRERSVAKARQDLAQEEADVRRLEFLVEQATIRAPFTGVVAEELIQAGEWVPEGGGVMRLVDLSTARVTVWVPEHIVGGLIPGDAVTVSTEAGDFRGKLHAVIPEGDPKSRTFPVEIRVDNRKGLLFAGMLARATFGIGEPEKALTVPKDAIVTRGDSSHLWKVVDGAAVRVPVTPGRTAENGRVEVVPQGELGAGDTVVTRGNERVRDGQAVVVTD